VLKDASGARGGPAATVGGDATSKGGSVAAPAVEELPPATTVDLGRFRREIELALEPAVAAIRARGGVAAIAQPRPEWISKLALERAARAAG
jgi:hypothetical protein